MPGRDMMVTPMVEPGNNGEVIFPHGKWKGDDGKIYLGDKSYEINVRGDRLPFFKRMN